MTELAVLIVVLSFVLYVIAYHTYGRFLARRVFWHLFTSIAGAGPNMGPAIAVVWGWVPALVLLEPMVFMLGTTFYAIVLLSLGFVDGQNTLLLGVSGVM